MSFDNYLSIIGKSAADDAVQQFLKKHHTQWDSVTIYQANGMTWGSLELYQSALEVEFAKKLTPKSSVMNKQDDFLISNITLINNTSKTNQSIGKVYGTITLDSNFETIVQVLGQSYSQNRQQGTYCWHLQEAMVEVDYDSISNEISYIYISSTSPQVAAIKEVAESLSDGVLSEQDSEELGIEIENIPYDDTPVGSDYDNIPVVERQTQRFPLAVILLAIVLALVFLNKVLIF